MTNKNTASGTRQKADIDFDNRFWKVANKDIAKVADIYHQWRNLNGNYTDMDGFCKAATLPEIEANNFVQSPGRYVGSEAEETDGVPFEEKILIQLYSNAA